MSPDRRPWILASGAVATVAAVALMVLILQNRDSGGGDDSPDSAATSQPGSPNTASTPADSGSAVQSPAGSPTNTAPAPVQAVAIYALGDTPRGPRLYREFRSLDGTDPLPLALAALTEPPLDPDYRTPWPVGAFAAASYDGSVITVTMADSALRNPPSGTSRATARAAVQQVVYTVQAAVQHRSPVLFVSADGPMDQVWGVPTAGPITHLPANDILALVNLTEPAEGFPTSGDLLVAGVANSFEATVPWQILRDGEVVKNGFFTAAGTADRLYPFRGDIDVSDLSPGTYVLRVQTDDPSDGEGPGPDQDTRSFVIG